MRAVDLRPTRGGFTLLELLLAVAAATLLLGGALAIANACMELVAESEEMRAAERERGAFHALLGRAFRELPPGARIELQSQEAGAGALETTLRLEEAPMAFRLGSAGVGEGWSVELRAKRAAGGALRILLEWAPPEGGGFGAAQGEAREIALIEDADVFALRLYDGRRAEWTPRWEPARGRPAMAEVTYAPAGGAQERWTWRIPEAALPPTPRIAAESEDASAADAAAPITNAP